MHYSSKKSILFQLILVVAGASIVSAIISSAGHYMFTSSLIKQSVSAQAENVLKLANTILDTEYTLHINHDLHLLQDSPPIREITHLDKQSRSTKYLQTQRLLHNFIRSSNGIYESILVIDKDENTLAYAGKETSLSEISSKEEEGADDSIKFNVAELFTEITNSPQEPSIFSGPIKREEGHLFFAGYKRNSDITNSTDGAIIITFNINKLTTHLSQIKAFEQSAIWLFTYNGESIYTPKNPSFHDPSEYIFKNKPYSDEMIITSSTRKAKDSLSNIVKIVISIPPKIIEKSLHQSLMLTTILLLSITCVVIIVAYFTSRKIVLPIQRLTILSQQVAAGDFNVRMPANTNDELGTLSQAFNIMIQELDEQRYELQSLANKDTLTQLPNRRQFEEHLGILVNSCDRNNQAIAVMYIDLDQFKDTNDSFGHPAGDKLIRDVSTRLSKTVRQSDLVARLGGDEFAIILNPHKTKADTEFVAKKILSELNKPFIIEKQQIFSGGSIGISIYPEHGSSAMELVKNADAAMYKAKNMGRNSYQFYSENLTKKANERVVLGALIRNAIVNSQFTLFYQPKVNLITKEIIGAEALLRWEHKGQTILPSKIVNIAESSGIIEKIDAWVLNKACAQIKVWEDANLPIMPVSINISGRLLEKNKIIGLLKQVLHRYSLDPKWIEIEITENDLISNHQQTQKALKIIHSLGVKIAIDDFGTGYSSLSYLKDLLADTLKIDRKFVVNAMTNHADREIATAIVKLARSLHMHVVVEGIETEEQETFFKDLGAHSAQGYLYAKAMPTKKFIEYVESSGKPNFPTITNSDNHTSH